jgi:aryl-alcohol dehydrogenase-like predicted oxidoreductase
MGRNTFQAKLHVPDPAIPFEASGETLAQLRDQGKISHYAANTSNLLDRAPGAQRGGCFSALT